MRYIKRLCLIPLAVAFVFTVATAVHAGDVPRISKEDLRDLLGNNNVVIIDVRTSSDWTSSDKKIAGAVRENPKAVNGWTGKYDKNARLVLYCA